MNRLRIIRREMDISQYELSLRTGVAQSSLSLFERFYKEPNLETKKQISKALHCRLEDVFPEQKEEKG